MDVNILHLMFQTLNVMIVDLLQNNHLMFVLDVEVNMSLCGIELLDI